MHMNSSRLIAAAALLLVSCADSDSSKTATADLTGESPRSVYQGADDFMGKSYPGFVMPENFDVPEIQRAYTVTFSSTIKEAAVEKGQGAAEKVVRGQIRPEVRRHRRQ